MSLLPPSAPGWGVTASSSPPAASAGRPQGLGLSAASQGCFVSHERSRTGAVAPALSARKKDTCPLWRRRPHQGWSAEASGGRRRALRQHQSEGRVRGHRTASGPQPGSEERPRERRRVIASTRVSTETRRAASGLSTGRGGRGSMSSAGGILGAVWSLRGSAHSPKVTPSHPSQCQISSAMSSLCNSENSGSAVKSRRPSPRVAGPEGQGGHGLPCLAPALPLAKQVPAPPRLKWSRGA